MIYMSCTWELIKQKLKFKNISAFHPMTVDVDIYDKVFAFDHIKRSGNPSRALVMPSSRVTNSKLFPMVFHVSLQSN
jgi:hypothetical protein